MATGQCGPAVGDSATHARARLGSTWASKVAIDGLSCYICVYDLVIISKTQTAYLETLHL